jgi:hypothetical protein
LVDVTIVGAIGGDVEATVGESVSFGGTVDGEEVDVIGDKVGSSGASIGAVVGSVVLGGKVAGSVGEDEGEDVGDEEGEYVKLVAMNVGSLVG